jgi:hypothetical protein
VPEKLDWPILGVVQTTDCEHDFEVYLNLAARMKVTAVNQLWVADITHIRLLREFVFWP